MEFELSDIAEYFKQRLDVLFFGVVGLLMIGLGVYEMRRTSFPGEELVVIEEEVGEDLVSSSVIVDVSGAVINPGVYRLEVGARTSQAIEAAGGFAEDADKMWISSQLNLASQLIDGEKIYIPFEGLVENHEGKVLSAVNSANNKINVNKATIEELKSLKGVGDVRAQEIIDNRPYANLEEFSTKSGLSEKILNDNLGIISVN